MGESRRCVAHAGSAPASSASFQRRPTDRLFGGTLPGSITTSPRRRLPRGVRSKREPLRVCNCCVARAYGILCQSAKANPPPKPVTMLEELHSGWRSRTTQARATSDFAILYYEQGNLIVQNNVRERSGSFVRSAISRRHNRLRNLGDISLARGKS